MLLESLLVSSLTWAVASFIPFSNLHWYKRMGHFTSVSAKTLQHYSAMECKMRRSYSAFAFPKAGFFLGISSVLQVFVQLSGYSKQNSLISFLILVVYVAMSHKLKGFAIWLLSLCSTVTCTTLPPPFLVVPTVSASTPMSKHQFKPSGLFSLQARGVILSCQAAMKPQWNHTVCISWLFAIVFFPTCVPLSSFSSFS